MTRILEVKIQRTVVTEDIYHVSIGEKEDEIVAMKNYFHGAKQNDRPILVSDDRQVLIGTKDVTDNYTLAKMSTNLDKTADVANKIISDFGEDVIKKINANKA